MSWSGEQPATVPMGAPSAPPPPRRSESKKRRRIWWAVIIGAVAIVAAVAHGSSKAKTTGTASATTTTISAPTTSGPKVDSSAISWIATNRPAVADGAASAASTLAILNSMSSGPAADVDLGDLADAAQQAHDTISDLRERLLAETNSYAFSTNVIDLEVAANDLKNSMGAVVAVTNTPDAVGTAAKVGDEVRSAVLEWDVAVAAIWLAAGEAAPPTIP